jgi:hypothetical protein
MSDRADEAIATQLDAAGAQAVARGAHATAAAAFERASELSEDPSRKGQRLLWAAQTSVAAGRSTAALALADRAQPLIQAQVNAAELDVVRTVVSLRQGSPADTFSLARSAAAGLGEREPERALRMVSAMVWASGYGGWAADGVRDAHAVLQDIHGGGDHCAFMQTMLDAAMMLLGGDAAGARDRFDQALLIADTLKTDPRVSRLAGLIDMWTADFEPARERFARVVAQLRAAGSLSELEGAMLLLAISEMLRHRVRAASEAAAEGLELLHQLGYEQDEICYLAVQAWAASLDCIAAAASTKRSCAGESTTPSPSSRIQRNSGPSSSETANTTHWYSSPRSVEPTGPINPASGFRSASWRQIAADSNIVKPSPSWSAGTRPCGWRSRCSSDRRSTPLISVKSYGAPISSSNHSTRLDRVRGM